MKKRIISLIMLALTLSLTACGAKPAKVDFAPRSDIEARLTNYKITVEFTGEDGVKTEMTEMRCDEGYLWAIGDSVLFIEYGSGKQYQLYHGNKTGIVTGLNNEDAYKKMGAVISAYLFFHEPYSNLEMTKSGSEKIAGFGTTAYTFTYGNDESKFWLCNEYGVTMKYTVKTGEQTRTMTVTELTVGGVTPADMVDLGEYGIVELT